uniref:Reverse transcriptase zinc-binding domain-containing protein n=1 Tax=Quercus lobata TaxID=97700 RepID=A0A7N2LR17_QUELO
MEATTPSSASYAWKSIIKGRKVIKKGVIWRIGGGKSIRVWGDNWLPGTDMNRVVSPCWRGAEVFAVSLFINQVNYRWKEDLLDYYLLEFEVEKIKAIPLSKTQQHDTLIWPHNPSGEYIVKPGYKFLLKEFQSQQLGTSNPKASKSLWEAVWKLNVPSKVKNLMWRACRDSLPTKSNLVRWKVLTDDACKILREDVVHALYSCPKLQELWNKCPQWKHEKFKLSPSFSDIMSSILVEDKNPALFSMVVWNIWNQQNNSRLGKLTTSIPQLLEQVQDRLQEFSNLHNLVSPSADTPASCWRPPDQGCFKINFDGAF